MARNKIRTIAQRVTIAVADYSAADKIATERVDMPAEYDEIIGYAVHIGDDSGVDNADYEVGLSNDNGEIEPFVHIGSVATAKNDGTNPDERFKTIGPEPIRGGGQIQCKLKLPAQNLATALTVVFEIKVAQTGIRTA